MGQPKPATTGTISEQGSFSIHPVWPPASDILALPSVVSTSGEVFSHGIPVGG